MHHAWARRQIGSPRSPPPPPPHRKIPRDHPRTRSGKSSLDRVLPIRKPTHSHLSSSPTQRGSLFFRGRRSIESTPYMHQKCIKGRGILNIPESLISKVHMSKGRSLFSVQQQRLCQFLPFRLFCFCIWKRNNSFVAPCTLAFSFALFVRVSAEPKRKALALRSPRIEKKKKEGEDYGKGKKMTVRKRDPIAMLSRSQIKRHDGK